TTICASTVIAPRRKPFRAEFKPAGNSRTLTCRTAVSHQAVTAQRIRTFLTFLTFPPHGALSREPATSSKRGRRKLAPGRSRIGRCLMTGGVSCQNFRLRHCPPRYRTGFFGRPVARV